MTFFAFMAFGSMSMLTGMVIGASAYAIYMDRERLMDVKKHG